MPQNSREIRRRIKSVRNIGQITKAMELVSAAKMRKAQTAAAASRPYAVLSSELLKNLLGKRHETAHPLLDRPAPEGRAVQPAHRTLMVLVTSDRGLAGSLNANVIAQALRMVRDDGAGESDFIAVGKKGADALRRQGLNMIGAFPGKDRGLTILDAQPIVKLAVDDYLGWKYDRAFVVYTDFVSTLVQKPKVLRLLPLAEESDETFIKASDTSLKEYLFEPGPDQVLDDMIYRYIDFAVYQCLQESAASEHSARMVAMRNANESSSELIDDLTLSANQARQAGITRELSEISAAKLAMEG